jgi:hypothetical protein
MLKKELPILEFDRVSDNIIEPSKFIKKVDMSDRVVMCFYSEVIEKLVNDGILKEIKTLYSQIGKHPIFELEYEGTSYHYVEPSREISVNSEAIRAIEKVLKAHNCKYLLVKTWSTDSIYRETIDKMKLRKNEGCLAVEMECSAFCAVAEYRNAIFGQMIYSGDDISCEEWNSRSEVDRKSVRETLFWFSVEASLEL